jgi:hypothetical protein
LYANQQCLLHSWSRSRKEHHHFSGARAAAAMVFRLSPTQTIHQY